MGPLPSLEDMLPASKLVSDKMQLLLLHPSPSVATQPRLCAPASHLFNDSVHLIVTPNQPPNAFRKLVKLASWREIYEERVRVLLSVCIWLCFLSQWCHFKVSHSNFSSSPGFSLLSPSCLGNMVFHSLFMFYFLHFVWPTLTVQQMPIEAHSKQQFFCGQIKVVQGTKQLLIRQACYTMCWPCVEWFKNMGDISEGSTWWCLHY